MLNLPNISIVFAINIAISIAINNAIFAINNAKHLLKKIIKYPITSRLVSYQY